MGRKRKNKLTILSKEQSKQIDSALKKTEKMKLPEYRKLFLYENKTYKDFKPEVVAGLFYARLNGELTMKELSLRCGFEQNLKSEEYEQLLMKHPRWAMLRQIEATEGNRELRIGGCTVTMPIGLMTTDKDIENLVWFNLVRLLTSPIEQNMIVGTKIAISMGYGFKKPDTVTPMQVIPDFLDEKDFIPEEQQKKSYLVEDVEE